MPETSEKRWSEISAAAVILGIVPDFSRSSMLTVHEMLEAQIAKGLVTKRKEGDHQSAPAYYKCRYEETEPRFMDEAELAARAS
jgi:hypothetical protein